MTAGETTPQVTQVTIRELTDFCVGLAATLQRDAAGAQIRPVVEEALRAECVQCGIQLTGAELLKVGEGAVEGDSKLERLKVGYCARNGCESHFYRLTRAANPQVDWAKLTGAVESPADDARAEEERAGAHARKMAQRKWNLLRIGGALALLLIVLVIRQIYVGGRIPFIREPEEFRVDHGP